MMKKIFFIIVAGFLSCSVFAQDLIKIDSAGYKLQQFYLNQHVENLWIAGHHINWQTGEPDKPEATKGIRTHCSAFVASVCNQLGVYILRPPQHSQELLANAQFDWLFSKESYDDGWRQITANIFITAQQYADNGFMVIVVAKSIDASKAGHIALVIPTEKTSDDLANEGPTLIQASSINTDAIPFRRSFRHHLTGWPVLNDSIAFFYNIYHIK